MPKATSRGSQVLIQRLQPSTPGEKRRRLRQRESWLKQVDLLQAFNELFDHMPEYRVFLKRRAGEIMFVNNAMLQTLRVKDEASLIGVTDHELTPGPLADLYRARDETVLRTGRPVLGVMEVWFTREGLPQWFICHKLPLKNRLGRIVGIIGFLKEYKYPSQLPVCD
ncbi:MAG: PAS domain-containing protein, partial [Synergistales bacterium]|nr:PAS domain-containing protein [Synergistales bacterium]